MHTTWEAQTPRKYEFILVSRSALDPSGLYHPEQGSLSPGDHPPTTRERQDQLTHLDQVSRALGLIRAMAARRDQINRHALRGMQREDQVHNSGVLPLAMWRWQGHPCELKGGMTRKHCLGLTGKLSLHHLMDQRCPLNAPPAPWINL